ncbi:MAG: hypothetical protein V3U88_07530 [Methylococcales bacterium]
MHLVDTSVWIDYINGKETEHVSFLDQRLSNPVAFGLNGLIYLEILQGANNQKAFEQFQRHFSGQQFYHFSLINLLDIQDSGFIGSVVRYS